MKKKNSRNKYLVRGLILILIGIIGLCIFIYNLNKEDKNPFEDNTKVTDAIKFKNEYEKLNDSNIKLIIDKKNPMKYISYDELLEILDEGTGIVYFGFPECPWCRNALPVLLEAAKENNIKEIYYFNAKDIRDEKTLDENGNIVTKKEGTEEYKTILEKLKDYLDPYEGLNNEEIKRLYFPNVFFISNGKVVGNHMSTVDSQEDPKTPLNKEQHNELKKIYTDNIKKVYNYDCNGGC